MRRVANRLIRLRPVSQRHRLAADLDQRLAAAVIEQNVAVRPVNTDMRGQAAAGKARWCTTP